MADNPKDWLTEQFQVWFDQVVRLSSKVTAVRLSDSTDRINGYSLNDLKAIIQGEVNAHEAKKPNKVEHNLTLAQLGGMSRGEFAGRMTSKFGRQEFPISVYRSGTMQYTPIVDNEFEILTGVIMLRGFGIVLGRSKVKLVEGVDKQYIFVEMQVRERVDFIRWNWVVYASASNVEKPNNAIIGKVENGALTFHDYLTFDGSRISLLPEGNSTPFSSLTPNSTGTVANTWF